MQPVLVPSPLLPRYSLVVPVYRNEGSLVDLIAAIADLNSELDYRLEAIFVVDGSPDASLERLRELLPDCGYSAKLVALSRNFGSFAAIREGLALAEGDYAAVMAADLQEPPELVTEFFRELRKDDVDVVFGVREGRDDPLATRLASGLFWSAYRRFVRPDVPPGGVDVFAVNRSFLKRLVDFKEANSSLLALLFWMGGRRRFVAYRRRERQHGASAWTFGKKLTYLMDSIFAFTDAPIRALLLLGGLGLFVGIVLAVVVLAARLTGLVEVPGYTATVLTVLFFGALNTFGLGVVGNYAWRAYENTKRRPSAIPMLVEQYAPACDRGDMDANRDFGHE